MNSDLARTAAIEELLDLPRSERREALEVLVVNVFKPMLLMAEADVFPLDESFFDLGFTSLLVNEAKVRLEELLGQPISANVLFNSPTAERLIEHLADDVLAEVFGEAGAGTAIA